MLDPVKPKCLVATCPYTDLAVRGLCSACYQRARLAVVSGEATWEELERLGLALTKKRGGRKRISKFMQALRDARTTNSPSPTPTEPPTHDG